MISDQVVEQYKYQSGTILMAGTCMAIQSQRLSSSSTMKRLKWGVASPSRTRAMVN